MSLSASLGLSWGQLAGLSELTLPGPGRREGWRKMSQAHRSLPRPGPSLQLYLSIGHSFLGHPCSIPSSTARKHAAELEASPLLRFASPLLRLSWETRQSTHDGLQACIISQDLQVSTSLLLPECPTSRAHPGPLHERCPPSASRWISSTS